MDDALLKIDAQIRSLRAFGNVVQSSMHDVADALEAQLASTIAAGTDPAGNAWPKTKSGETPLTHAAGALTVTVVDNSVVFRLRGPEARHHLGTARGRIVRAVIPKGVLPASWLAIIRSRLASDFSEAFRG